MSPRASTEAPASNTSETISKAPSPESEGFFRAHRKARAGQLSGFTGIDGSYQAPVNAELMVDNGNVSVSDATDAIERMLAERGTLFQELADLAANI